MPAINEVQGVTKEIVLTERVTTTDFRIVEIHESIQNRFVRADIELGPFVNEERPGGQTTVRGTGRRGVTVWSNEEYDAIRDTWANADLMAAIKVQLEA